MVVSKINTDLQNVSVIKSVGTATKAVAISSAELAVSSIHFSKSVGLVGEIIYLNLLEVRDELLAEQALAKAEKVEVAQ